MLPTNARLRSAAEFAAAVRRGRRAGTRHLVIHLLRGTDPVPPRAGFVVSGKVGNSVVRHRVTRRLRPLVRERLAGLDAGSTMVVRALPAAATATSGQLAEDLTAGIAAAIRRSGPAGRATRSGEVAGRSGGRDSSARSSADARSTSDVDTGNVGSGRGTR